MAQIKVGRTNKLYKGRIVDRFAYVAIGLSQDLIEWVFYIEVKKVVHVSYSEFARSCVEYLPHLESALQYDRVENESVQLCNHIISVRGVKLVILKSFFYSFEVYLVDDRKLGSISLLQVKIFVGIHEIVMVLFISTNGSKM